MTGNVKEWCSDHYGSYKGFNETNPTGSTASKYCVLRGGSWDDLYVSSSRTLNRSWSDPGSRSGNYGFRLVMENQISISEAQNDIPFQFVAEMPSYPGGEKAMYDFLYKNISYPEQELSQNKEGTVYVNFVVEEDGTLSNFIVTRGVEGAKGLDLAALEACKKLGRFYPGKQNGKVKRVYLTLPIKFTLAPDNAPSSPANEPQKRNEYHQRLRIH
jgi:TonB family protein